MQLKQFGKHFFNHDRRGSSGPALHSLGSGWSRVRIRQSRQAGMGCAWRLRSFGDSDSRGLLSLGLNLSFWHDATTKLAR